MKASSLFLSLSIVANGVLLAFLASGAFSSRSEAPVPEMRPVPTKAAPANVVAAQAWNELQAEDLTAQIARLKAEGFPPSMIRAITRAQIRERYAARRKALADAEAATPYWLPTTQDPKLQAELRALGREEQKTLKDLLGPDLDSGYAASLRRSLSHFAPERIEQLAEIQERYGDQRSELYASARGSMLAEDRQKLEAIEKAMYAEISSVLSPTELEDFDLRLSRTASQLRYTLSAFDATEQEYRAIYKLQRAFDDQYGYMGAGMTQDQMRQRSEGQRQLAEQIKATLGEARYAEYQRGTDSDYRNTVQIVERLKLPAATASEIYTLQQSTQQRASELRRSGIGADQSASLRAMATEAEAQIAAKLGPSGLATYKQYAGNWLANLAPRPPPAATKQ